MFGFVAVLLPLLASPHSAGSSSPARVRVLCGKSSRLDAFTWRVARTEAEAIFRREEIELEWVSEDSNPAPPLLVVLLRASSDYPVVTRAEALGVTLMASDQRPGRVSVLFWDRLEDLAGRGSRERLGRALGRAMAHEIGHALKRQAAHSSTGLLQAEIARSRWCIPNRTPFFMTPEDGRVLRALLRSSP